MKRGRKEGRKVKEGRKEGRKDECVHIIIQVF